MSRYTRLVFGTDSRGALCAVGAGLLFGLAAWLAYPVLGGTYWLWPSSLVDWGFVLGFLLLATGVAFADAGFLAAWWVTLPAHVAISHYVYSGTFVVLPFRSDFLSFLLISAQIAFLYGVAGYVLGISCRRGFDRLAVTSGRSMSHWVK